MVKKIDLREKAIKSFLTQFHPVSNELVKYLTSISHFKEIKKGNMLVTKGGSISNIYLITNGIIRSFVKVQNKEITNWITCENELVTSISSYFIKEVSKENMQALEKTTLIVFEREKIELTYKKFPELNLVIRKVMEQYYVQAEERAFIVRLPHAKDKWEYLFANLNKFVNRVPLKYTASFLGIRLETLSRIRNLIK